MTSLETSFIFLTSFLIIMFFSDPSLHVIVVSEVQRHSEYLIMKCLASFPSPFKRSKASLEFGNLNFASFAISVGNCSQIELALVLIISSVVILWITEVMYTAPMSISRTDFTKIRSRLAEVIKEVTNTAIHSKAEDIVYFGIDFFWIKK